LNRQRQSDISEGRIPTTEELWTAVNRFCAWLENSGDTSYDPYDILGTRYGCWARRLYYTKHPLGPVLMAPLILMEVICPQLRGLFVTRGKYATANAQLALAFLNLYELLREQADNKNTAVRPDDGPGVLWLTKATQLAKTLLSQSIPGYSGFCWGYPFDWQNVNGLMPKDTPHITATPYCYEVFTRLFELTGEENYLEVARSVANFVFCDLNDTIVRSDAAASSYTPYDHSKVVNASAYRAFVLFDAASRFQEESFYAKAWKNLRFILQSQQADGSWLYAIDNAPEAFIDHFHTCFVLKNLYKVNRHLRNSELRRSIQNGYRFYRQALFDENDNPRSFAVAPRLQIVSLEMYNMAEAITLGSLLQSDIPEAFLFAQRLTNRLVRKYQLRAGHWVTRIYVGGIRHTLPFLRWPQSQLFYALTNLLVAKEQGRTENVPMFGTVG